MKSDLSQEGSKDQGSTGTEHPGLSVEGMPWAEPDPCVLGLVRTDPASPHGFEQGRPTLGSNRLSPSQRLAAALEMRTGTRGIVTLFHRGEDDAGQEQSTRTRPELRPSKPPGRGRARGEREGLGFFPSPCPQPRTPPSRLLSHNGCQNTARQGIITDTYCGHYTTSTGCAK